MWACRTKYLSAKECDQEICINSNGDYLRHWLWTTLIHKIYLHSSVDDDGLFCMARKLTLILWEPVCKPMGCWSKHSIWGSHAVGWCPSSRCKDGEGLITNMLRNVGIGYAPLSYNSRISTLVALNCIDNFS